MKTTDLNWIAGFYEGEGSAGFYRINRNRNNKLHKSFRLMVGISQIEKSILVWIKDTLNMGSIGTWKNNKRNTYGWKCKPIYRYCLANNMARRFLKLIIPYMKARHKIKQAKEALRKDTKYIKGRWNDRV